MKALLPVFCRPLGYVILILSLFLPFMLAATGRVTDSNLLFYKECTKILMMIGALMILLALSKHESATTETIRVNAMRNAIVLTFVFIFGNMIYRFVKGEVVMVETSSFLIFLVFNVLCLEFGMKKATINKMFGR